MLEKLWSYRQIDDLRRDYKSSNALRNDYDRRALVPIAVIDDQPFQYEQALTANGYKVDFLGDIRNIDQVKPYNIVLCDLQGVGKFLNTKNQGAFIIDEIKRNHPEKFVIAYTGGSPDDAITIRAQQFADFFIKKDADIDDWRDRLDSIISELSNPINVWNRQRDALIQADVPTLDILKLEDAYVKSIQIKSEAPYVNLVNSSSLSRDLRAIAQSLVASGIFQALVGS